MQAEIKDLEYFQEAIDYIEEHTHTECRPIRVRLARVWNAVYADIYSEMKKAQLLKQRVPSIVFLGLLAKAFDPTNPGKAVNWLTKLSIEAEISYLFLLNLPEVFIWHSNLFHLCLLYKALIDYFSIAKKLYHHMNLAQRLRILLINEHADWCEELYAPIRESLWHLSCFFQPLKLSHDFLDDKIPTEAKTMELIRQHLTKERQFENSIRLDAIKVKILEDAYGTRRGILAIFDPKRSGLENIGSTKRIFLIFAGMDIASVWWLTAVTCCTNAYPPEFPACITHQGVARIHNQLHSCTRQFLKLCNVTPDDDLHFQFSGFGLGGAFAQLSGLRLAANFPNANLIVQTLSSPLVILKPPLFNLRLKDRLYILNLFQSGTEEAQMQQISNRHRGWTDNKLVRFPVPQNQVSKSWVMQLAECWRVEANFEALVKLDEDEAINPFLPETTMTRY